MVGAGPLEIAMNGPIIVVAGATGNLGGRGDELGAREPAAVVSDVTGGRFRLLRAGSSTALNVLIRIARLFDPGRNELYPARQGMQYMRNMFDGQAKLRPLDNDHYPDMSWTKVRDVLPANLARGR